MSQGPKLSVQIGSDLRDIKQGLAELRNNFGELRRESAQRFKGVDTLTTQLRGAASAARNLLGILGVSLGAGALVSFARGQLNAADATGKAAQALGVQVEALSRLQFAASLANVETGQLTTGLARLSKDLPKQAGLLRQLGVEVKDSTGSYRDVIDIVRDVSEVFRELPERGPARAQLAVRLFGQEAGPRLVPLLAQGRAAIDALGERSDQLGATISASAAASAERFNDNVTELKVTAMAFGRSVLADVIPTLADFVRGLTDTAAGSSTAATAGKVLLVGFRALAFGATAVRGSVEILTNFLLALADTAVETGKVVAVALQRSVSAAERTARGLATGGFLGALRGAVASVGEVADSTGEAVEGSLGRLKAAYSAADSGISGALREIEASFTALWNNLDGGRESAAAAGRGLAATTEEGRRLAALLQSLLGDGSKTDSEAKRKAEALRRELERLRKEAERADEARRRELIDLETRIARGLEDVELALLRAGGQTAEAAIIETRRRWEALLADLRATSNEAGIALVERLINTEALAARLAEFKQRASEIGSTMAAAETSISAQASAGMLGGLEAERRIADIRQKSLDQLRELRTAVAAYYNETKDASVLQFLGELEGKIADVVAAQERLKQDLIDAAESSLAGFFMDLVDAAGSASDAFKQFARNFARSMARVVSEALAAKAVLATLSLFGGGATAGGATAGSFHTGGIVGFARATRRELPAYLSVMAEAGKLQRFHSGGFPGLKANEIPAVLERGEEVLAKNDSRNRLNGGGNERPAPGYRIINVVDPAMVGDYLDSAAGEERIFNLIGRNPGRVRTLIG